MHKSKSVRFAVALLGIHWALGTAGAAAHEEVRDASYTLDIPAQGLNEALQALALASKHELLYPAKLVDGMSSAPLKGSFTTEEAVKHLLAGTDLTYEVTAEGLVVIKSARSNDLSRAVGGDERAEENQARLTQAAESSPPSSPQPAQNPSAVSEEEGTKLEEIVVTAQRREQPLQDVPISITVLSGEALDKSTGDGVLAALERVAGVAVTPGGNFGSAISIRGVAPPFASFFTSSPIGYYLDSVPFGFVKAAFVPDMGAYDLERVEVLRGPQGTLYGASSVGGLIRILSKDADLNSTEFKISSSLSDTQYGGLNYGGDAAVNVPIVEDVVAARLVAGYHDLSGWIDQPNAGRNDANDGLNQTLRLKINAQPTDALSLEVSTWFSRNEDGAPPQGNDSRQYLTSIDETQYSDFDLYAFELGYDFDAFSLSSATSYMSYGFVARSDDDTLGSINLDNKQFSDIFSQEFQLSSTNDGPWRWTAGAIYRDVEERLYQNRTDSSAVQSPFYFAPNDITSFSESYAAYGELTRTFLDGQLELTGGLRYFHDEIHAREDSNSTGGPPVGETRFREFEKVSPRLVLTWLPSEDFTAYASYSEGFRSGVDQSPIALSIDPTLPEVQPDNLQSYEIGAKGAVLNGALRYDVSAYYVHWEDVQSADVVFANPYYFSATFNAASLSGPGIDLSLIARPTNHLSLGTSVGWNDLAYDEDVTIALFGNAVVYYEGDRPSFAPQYTGSVWIDYAVPLSGDGHALRFNASGNYISERLSRLFGIESDLYVNDPLITAAARVTLETPENWSLSLFADNLTNSDTPTTGFEPFGRTDTALRMRPRTIGLQVDYRFGK